MRLQVIAILLAAALAQAQPTAQLRQKAESILNDALSDRNPDTRKQAVQALGLVSLNGAYLTQLEGMLTDRDVEVRVAAINTLVDLKNKRTVPALKKTLDDDVPEVSFAAAKALWLLNEPAGREALVAVLSGESKTSSGFVTRQKRDALRMLHTPKTAFLFALREGASIAPVPGLGAGMSSVQGILSDPGVSGRAATALLLSGDRSPEVLAALREALNDDDWSVRAAAVHALASRGDSSLKNALIPLLDDRKEAVRVRAAAGYLRLATARNRRTLAASKK
jgi:HEAT repeat protein